MTENDLYNMELNNIIYFNEEKYAIQKVIGGWIYLYYDINDAIKSSTFVPYPASKNMENTDFHKDWIVQWSDKNNKSHAKHMKFTDENHKNNWENKWIDFGNKIFGWNKANSLGELIN